MPTFICFISRQNGVHSIRSTIRHNVYMHTIGRILEESLIYLIMIAKTFAIIGNQALSLQSIMKDVRIKQAARAVTDGKSKSITLNFIKRNPAKKKHHIIVL